MNTLVTRKTAIAAIISLSVAYPAYAAVPNTFSSGQAASAADVNENFNDLDGRVSTLEAASVNPTSVAVNCGADPEALKNTAFEDDTTYNITGACNGPIYVEKDRVHLLGTSNTNDSIVLPSGLNGEGAIEAGGAYDLQITNLFLNLTATTPADQAAGIWARDSFLRIRDSRVEGGNWGIYPFRSSIVRLDGSNSITEFSDTGLIANDNSNINTRDQTTVSSSRVDSTSIKGVGSFRSSTVDIRGGITVSVPTGERSIQADSNSTIRIRNSGTVTLTGDIRNGSNSTILIEKGTINGNVDLRRSSVMEMENGIIITGNVRVDEANWTMYGGSVTGDLDIRRSSSVKMDSGVVITGDAKFESADWYMEDTSISGSIEARRGSALTFYDVTQTSNENNEINLAFNSTLSAERSNLDNATRVEFNSSFVAANSTLGYISAYGNSSVDLRAYDGGGASTVRGGELHLGSVSSISNTSSTGDFSAFPPSGTHITGTTNLNGNNVYGCNTSGYIDVNTVIGIANLNTSSSDCRP